MFFNYLLKYSLSFKWLINYMLIINFLKLSVIVIIILQPVVLVVLKFSFYSKDSSQLYFTILQVKPYK